MVPVAEAKKTPPHAGEFTGKTLEDQLEIVRQSNLLRGAFDYIADDRFLSPEVRERRMAIMGEIRGWVERIHKREALLDDFLAYQDEKFENPEFRFLGEVYPGLNVAGWRVILALIDPMKYGRNIQSYTKVTATISKRS